MIDLITPNHHLYPTGRPTKKMTLSSIQIPSGGPLTRQQLEELSYSQVQNQARSRNISGRKRVKAELIEDILAADPPPNVSSSTNSLQLVHEADSYAPESHRELEADSRAASRPQEEITYGSGRGQSTVEEDTPYIPPREPEGKARASRDPTQSPYLQHYQLYHRPSPHYQQPTPLRLNSSSLVVAGGSPEAQAHVSSCASRPSSPNGRVPPTGCANSGSISSAHAHAGSSIRSLLRLSTPDLRSRSRPLSRQTQVQAQTQQRPQSEPHIRPLTPTTQHRIYALHEHNAYIHQALWETHALLEEQASRLEEFCRPAIGEMHELRIGSEVQMGVLSQRAIDRTRERGERRWVREPFGEAGDDGDNGGEGEEEGEKVDEAGVDQGDEERDGNDTTPADQANRNVNLNFNLIAVASQLQAHPLPQENTSPQLEYQDGPVTVVHEYSPLLAAQPVGHHESRSQHTYEGVARGSVPWPIRDDSPIAELQDGNLEGDDEDDDDDDDDDYNEDADDGKAAFWQNGFVADHANADADAYDEYGHDYTNDYGQVERSSPTGYDATDSPVYRPRSHSPTGSVHSVRPTPPPPNAQQARVIPAEQECSSLFSPDGIDDFDNFNTGDALDGIVMDTIPTPPAEAAAATAAALSAHAPAGASEAEGGPTPLLLLDHATPHAHHCGYGGDGGNGNEDAGLGLLSASFEEARAQTHTHERGKGVATPDADVVVAGADTSPDHTFGFASAHVADLKHETPEGLRRLREARNALKRTREPEEEDVGPEDGPSSAKRMRR